MAIVGRAALAKALDVSERRINQLVQEGMPRTEHGAYDFGACVCWFVRYQRKLLEKKDLTHGEDGYREGKARVVRLDGDRKELELMRLRGELIDLESVRAIWERACVRARQKMISLVSKQAPHHVGIKSVPKARALLESLVNSSLEALSMVGHEVRRAALKEGWIAGAAAGDEEEAEADNEAGE